MKIDYAQKFMIKEHNKIMHLFLMYQMVELLLFLNLYLPEISIGENRNNEFKDMNKKLNSKTFGNLIKKYMKKFPDDKFKLKDDLELIRIQRNSFMHQLWINISLCINKKEASKFGNLILKKHIDQISIVLNKIPKISGGSQNMSK